VPGVDSGLWGLRRPDVVVHERVALPGLLGCFRRGSATPRFLSASGQGRVRSNRETTAGAQAFFAVDRRAVEQAARHSDGINTAIAFLVLARWLRRTTARRFTQANRFGGTYRRLFPTDIEWDANIGPMVVRTARRVT
jgi:hypothetical protein